MWNSAERQEQKRRMESHAPSVICIYFTLTMQERVVSSTVTFTFAVPLETAVTVPEALTVATLVSLEANTGVPLAPFTESLKLS